MTDRPLSDPDAGSFSKLSLCLLVVSLLFKFPRSRLARARPALRLGIPTLQRCRPTLLALYLELLKTILSQQAVTAGVSGPSEADRLTFVVLAPHVLSYRSDNAGGLFPQLLRRRHFDYVTQAEEDRAQRRLKRHLYDSAPPVLPVLEAAFMRAR